MSRVRTLLVRRFCTLAVFIAFGAGAAPVPTPAHDKDEGRAAAETGGGFKLKYRGGVDVSCQGKRLDIVSLDRPGRIDRFDIGDGRRTSSISAVGHEGATSGEGKTATFYDLASHHFSEDGKYYFDGNYVRDVTTGKKAYDSKCERLSNEMAYWCFFSGNTFVEKVRVENEYDKDTYQFVNPATGKVTKKIEFPGIVKRISPDLKSAVLRTDKGYVLYRIEDGSTQPLAVSKGAKGSFTFTEGALFQHEEQTFSLDDNPAYKAVEGVVRIGLKPDGSLDGTKRRLLDRREEWTKEDRDRIAQIKAAGGATTAGAGVRHSDLRPIFQPLGTSGLGILDGELTDSVSGLPVPGVKASATTICGDGRMLVQQEYSEADDATTIRIRPLATVLAQPEEVRSNDELFAALRKAPGAPESTRIAGSLALRGGIRDSVETQLKNVAKELATLNDPKRVAAELKNLDSDAFLEREGASKFLASVVADGSKEMLDQISDALRKSDSAEVRNRAEPLLRQIERRRSLSPDHGYYESRLRQVLALIP